MYFKEKKEVIKMIIEIWSDFACPFCYIGKRRFEQALSEFKYKDDVRVIYKSFLLDPNAPKTTNKTALEELAESKGISIEEAKKQYEHVTKMAKTVNLNYNLDKIRATSTIDAHRLVKYADSKINVSDLIESLYDAYFVQGLNLSDYHVLANIATNFNLVREEVIEMLNSNRFLDKVEKDIFDARNIGVTSVPTFVANRKKGVSGALKSELLLNFLIESYEKDEDLVIFADDSSCGIDGC